MKILPALLLLVVLCSVHLVTNGIQSSDLPSSCCVNRQHHMVPLKAIVSYYKTPSNCAKRALVFVTKRGLRICVAPDLDWVKSHVASVDSRQTAAAMKTTKTKVTFGHFSPVRQHPQGGTH